MKETATSCELPECATSRVVAESELKKLAKCSAHEKCEVKVNNTEAESD